MNIRIELVKGRVLNKNHPQVDSRTRGALA